MYGTLRSAPPETYVALLWFLWITRVRTMPARRLLGTFLGLVGLSLWLLLGYALTLVGVSASVLVTTLAGTPFVLLGAYYVVTGGPDEQEAREEELSFVESRGP